ncbi:hypothetical protein LCGC14_2421380, partial [marine sediment metagenome]
KIYDRVMSDATLRPLTYRYPDPTRFREISAGNQKMQKKAQGMMDMDLAAMDAQIQGMGVTDPTDIQAMKDVLTKYQATPVGSTPIGTPPATVNPAAGGGAFMNGVGLSNKLNMQKNSEFPIQGEPLEDLTVDPWEQAGVEALYTSVMDGLSFAETYDAVRNATQGNALITQAEFEQMGQLITGDKGQQGIIASKAAELIKQAEVDTVKHLHKTAEIVQDEFKFDDMNSSETAQWIDTYVNTYNKSLDNGDGLIEASRVAHKTAADALSTARIKLALRDKDTLVPLTETDPDYSIATTDEFEAEFGGKYEDTDGGILPMEDREYTTMFKGTASEINRRTTYADVKQKGDKWVVTPKGSEKVLGEHSTEEKAVSQLQAIEISKHKQSSIVKKAVYELTPEGQNILAQLTQGQLVAGPNSDVLHTVLRWVLDNPAASLDEMAASQGGDINMLQQAVQYALTTGYINITPGDQMIMPDNMQEGMPPGALANTSKLNMQKSAEPTGFDLDADDVGQNPINYSRLKGQIQDLL